MLRYHLSVVGKRRLKESGQELDVQKYYEAVAKKGRKVRTLEERPSVRPGHAAHWEAFQYLNAQRGAGLAGMEPIRGSEIASYLDERQVHDFDTRQEFHRVITTLDQVMRGHICEEDGHD